MYKLLEIVGYIRTKKDVTEDDFNKLFFKFMKDNSFEFCGQFVEIDARAWTDDDEDK